MIRLFFLQHSRVYEATKKMIVHAVDIDERAIKRMLPEILNRVLSGCSFNALGLLFPKTEHSLTSEMRQSLRASENCDFPACRSAL